MIPSEAEIDRAAAIIKHGGLVAFPTETVYGLGADATNPEAIARVFALKGRPLSSPLIVHVSSEDMARAIVRSWPSSAAQLAARFWPGPLTMILPKQAIIPDTVTSGLDSVGVRIPSHPVALALIRRAGVPIAAPSANRFGEISPTTCEHVVKALGDAVDMVLDGGPAKVGIESTVVLLTQDHPVVLRPGMIPIAELEQTTNLKWSARTGTEPSSASPGLQPRHYAPRTPFFLLTQGQPVPPGTGRLLELPENPQEFAETLYAEMHSADEGGWDWIAVREPPDTPEWAGIRDRLQRASTKKVRAFSREA